MGQVTIVFMYAIGTATLLADIPDEARRALALFHSVATEVRTLVPYSPPLRFLYMGLGDTGNLGSLGKHLVG